MKHLGIILAALLVVSLPFIFRQRQNRTADSASSLRLVIVTPHNEAIRQSFGEGFSRWHRKHYGTEVLVDWRAIGGTTEIMRYLEAEYVSAARLYFENENLPWPANGATALLSDIQPNNMPAAYIWQKFREVDSAHDFGCGMDIFFGGGVYDHAKAARQGLTVAAWPREDVPDDVFSDAENNLLIPKSFNGEQWRSDIFYGTALSTFGICCNLDRLLDLGIKTPPSSWADLVDPRLIGQIGLTDPTKSGSIAKTFEMIIHSRCAQYVAAQGYSREDIIKYEKRIKLAALPIGVLPPDVPSAYQHSVEQGWIAGVQLIRRLGAQARYFTVNSGKVPVDVSMGLIAAGVCIDFYGRYQSELSTLPNGRAVMTYITPVGGSSVTADPISLLRGAKQRQAAVRFIRYVLSEDGQKLWNYRRNEPEGPTRYSLRRLPIRRDFYPSDNPVMHAAFLRHKPHLSDPLWRPEVDAYRLAEAFLYQSRWTGRHFGVQRDLIKAMCLDSGEELRAAWRAIVAHGGDEANPEAMKAFEALPGEPYPLTWKTVLTDCATADRLDMLREWSTFFRHQYRLARRLAENRQN
jgi:iron(III) transport system substrate-binding protein